MHPKSINETEYNSMSSDSRCKGKTKKGRACRAAATKGGLCFFHANPNKTSELGRIGGRKNRHAKTDAPDPLPRLETAMAVRTTVARLIEDVYTGKLNPKIASGLAPLLNLQLRAIESSDLEDRLTKLEGLLIDGKLNEFLDGKLQGIEFDSNEHQISENTQGEAERREAWEKANGFGDGLKSQ
jgi:hypothetical protein